MSKKYFYWRTDGKYCGTCNSTICDVSEGGNFVHQAFEMPEKPLVPPFPGLSKPELKEKMSTHKDWDGPGVYDCWDDDKEWNFRMEFDGYVGMSNYWQYKKVQGFVIPDAPKEELEDGWYLVVLSSGLSDEKVREKRKDSAYDINGLEQCLWKNYTVLKRVILEDIS